MSLGRLCQVLLCLTLLAGLFTTLLLSASEVPIEATRLGDGVILWAPSRGSGHSTDKPPLFAKFEEWTRLALPLRADLPFDRSIAFLIGVSRYQILNSLPFVENDLKDMKDYLLLRGGFDQVYVVSNEVASSELIESYMMNKFPSELGKRDRLLFYYAGHGADAHGTTGYLQLAKARTGDFAHNVLAVSRAEEWARVNPASHLLFLLDTCSSGLAFTPRGRPTGDGDEQLIQTLSGQGSRTVVTAGIAGEQTFEIRPADGHGNGIFTWALLRALDAGRLQEHSPAFFTIEQAVAELQVTVAKFASEHGKSLHPKLWPFDDIRYRGSFVFLNPAVKHSRVPMSQLNKLGARGDPDLTKSESQALGPSLSQSQASPGTKSIASPVFTSPGAETGRSQRACLRSDIILRSGSVVESISLECGPRDAGMIVVSAPNLRFTADLTEIQEGRFPGRVVAFERLRRIDFGDLDQREQQVADDYYKREFDFFNRKWRTARVEFIDGHVWERIYVYDNCSFKSTYEDGSVFDLNPRAIVFRGEQSCPNNGRR